MLFKKSIVLFACSFLINFTTSEIFAQGLNSWVQRSSFTGAPRINAVSFSILDKAYVGTGKDTSGIYLKDFWEYDPTSDTWSQKADFSGTARSAAIGFGIDSAGFIGLGDDGFSYLKDLWKYEPFSNTWSQMQDLGLYQSVSSLGRKDAAVTVLAGKAYVICGYDGTTSNSKQCWQFDPAADTSWTLERNFANATDFTVIGRRWAIAFNVNANSSIYFGMGFDHVHSYKKDLWKYNTATDVWMQVADLPGQSRSNASAFSVFGKGYVLCGSNLTQQFDMYRYDTGINSWTRMADYPGSSSSNNISFVINNRVFLGMGNDSLNVFRQDLWEYIPDSTTGINETEFLVNTDIYPMPVLNNYNLKLEGKNLQFPITMKLYDISGKMCGEEVIYTRNTGLSRKNIPSGIYFYSLSFREKLIRSGKLIFQ